MTAEVINAKQGLTRICGTHQGNIQETIQNK